MIFELIMIEELTLSIAPPEHRAAREIVQRALKDKVNGREACRTATLKAAVSVAASSTQLQSHVGIGSN